MIRRWLACLAAGVLLAGCAQTPPLKSIRRLDDLAQTRPVAFFRLDGRLSVRAQDRNFSGSLSWQRRSVDDETLALVAPLGQTVAEVRRVPEGMQLSSADGKVFRAESAGQLLDQVVGVRLPVEGLVYWLSALPEPEREFLIEQAADGRVAVLKQDGWTLRYDRYRSIGGRDLPGRIFAQRDEELEFRLILDAWETLP